MSDQPAGENEADPDAIHFAQVSSGFYRNVNADSVWRGLRYAIRHQLPAKNPTIMMMFVRIAEVYPEVREFLNQQTSAADEAQRAALQLILQPPAGIRAAEYLPSEIMSPGEMDLCWSEFLVTGSTKPIDKVVAVLDRPDLAREQISDLLSGDSAKVPVEDKNLDELTAAGIALARTDGPWKVVSPGDIDIMICFGLKDQNPTCIKIAQAMSEQLRVHLATKGAAIWSLRANAAQHGKIRMLCEVQSELPGGSARLMITP